PRLRRLCLAVARRWPGPLRVALRAAYHPLRDVEAFYRRMVADAPEPDRAVLARPEIWSALVTMTAEALRQGFRGFVHELALLARPWDLALHRIAAPVHVWHGVHDVATPLAMGRHLAKVIPGARLTVFPDGGHFLMYTHAETIVPALSASLAA